MTIITVELRFICLIGSVFLWWLLLWMLWWFPIHRLLIIHHRLSLLLWLLLRHSTIIILLPCWLLCLWNDSSLPGSSWSPWSSWTSGASLLPLLWRHSHELFLIISLSQRLLVVDEVRPWWTFQHGVILLRVRRRHTLARVVTTGSFITTISASLSWGLLLRLLLLIVFFTENV